MTIALNRAVSEGSQPLVVRIAGGGVQSPRMRRLCPAGSCSKTERTPASRSPVCLSRCFAAPSPAPQRGSAAA